MPISEKELQALIPNIRGLIDPKVEFRLDQAFRRLYEIMNLKLEDQRKSFEMRLQTIYSDIIKEQNKLTGLIGSLSQPLVGGSTPDLILQSVVSSYGPQSPNHFLAGPIPSFRAITQSDLPPTIASQLDADGTILDIGPLIDGEYIRRTGNTIVSGVPAGTTNLVEGILPNAEGILYTTPIDHRTKITNVLLFNNSAGALVANVLAKDPLNNIIYTDNFNLASLEKIIITLNLILPFDYTFRGFTSAIGAVEYSIFGIEEQL